MAFFDDEPKKKPKTHVVGEDVTLLSAGELAERIDQMKQEIARLEAEIAKRGSSRAAAEGLFKS